MMLAGIAAAQGFQATLISALSRLAWAAMWAAVTPAAASAQASLRAEGTEFVLTTAHGRILRGAELQGATLQIKLAGGTIGVLIGKVEEDAHAVGGRVLLHHFVVKERSGHTMDLCAPDAQGRSLGFPVPDGRGSFDLTCTSGAVGKCIRWGYRPWEGEPGGLPMQALHQACVHMTRADYGGDGHPSTRDGTQIDLYDRFGIQKPDRILPMTFEAAWGTEGAICVARPRIPESIALEQLGERYPHLKDHLGPAVCTEESAARDPRALLFNRSWQ